MEVNTRPQLHVMFDNIFLIKYQDQFPPISNSINDQKYFNKRNPQNFLMLSLYIRCRMFENGKFQNYESISN